jgi:putative ABC transport system substrate-binding protein
MLWESAADPPKWFMTNHFLYSRREFITLLGGTAVTSLASPFGAPAQQAQQASKVARIGLLSPFSPSAAALWHEAFRQGLRDLGWVEGKNLSVEYRYAEERADRLPDLVTDLVRLNVDVIVASISTDALVAKQATKTIPIVMASAGDPVASGLVESLARPGGNITGLSQLAPELAGKRLDLLKKMIPTLSRVAVLKNPQNPTSSSTLMWNETQLPAQRLGVQLYPLDVRSSNDFDKAFKDAISARADALVITPDPLFAGNVKPLSDFAARSRLPSIFHLREFADAGGLVSYGIDRSDQFRRAATYVDKILKGVKPADLPVQQPTRFELVINLKTARALGLEVPPTLLVLADEVIE